MRLFIVLELKEAKDALSDGIQGISVFVSKSKRDVNVFVLKIFMIYESPSSFSGQSHINHDTMETVSTSSNQLHTEQSQQYPCKRCLRYLSEAFLAIIDVIFSERFLYFFVGMQTAVAQRIPSRRTR